MELAGTSAVCGDKEARREGRVGAARSHFLKGRENIGQQKRAEQWKGSRASHQELRDVEVSFTGWL